MMQYPSNPLLLREAEAAARRRLGVPSERELALLALRDRPAEALAGSLRARLADAAAVLARRLAAVAEDLDPSVVRRTLRTSAQR
jgi:hypothetical protein